MSCSTQHTRTQVTIPFCFFLFYPSTMFLLLMLSQSRTSQISTVSSQTSYGILEASLIHAWPLLRPVKPSTQSAPGPGLERCSWIFNEPIVLVFEWIGTTGWVGALSGQLDSDVTNSWRAGSGRRLGVTEHHPLHWRGLRKITSATPVNWDILMSFIYTDANKNETK